MGAHVEECVGLIKARVVAHSRHPDRNINDIVTFELEYPRFIHSEFMTHRLFSRNAASSRAIPSKKAIRLVKEALARPLYYADNQRGMQAGERISGIKDKLARAVWWTASRAAILAVRTMGTLGVHKQWSNRMIEPYQMIKVVVTSTEWNNFFALREHKDAQPEIRALARVMHAAMRESTPVELEYGMLHVPYIETIIDEDGVGYYTPCGTGLPAEKALKLSASACAQVSYRVLDLGLDKAEGIYKALVSSRPVHASPFEHQAAPMKNEDWPSGATHVDRNGNFWSGNFRGWEQHRQSIEDNFVEG